jgi:hypothetical protein
MEVSRYQVTQDDKEYILSTAIVNDKIRIECQDNNFPSSPIYSKDFSLIDLRTYSEIFTLVHSISEAQNELNNTIEKQQVTIVNQGDSMEIAFVVQIGSYEQELIFQLPIKNKSSQNYVQQTLPRAQISPQVIMNEPIYKEINLPQYTTNNNQNGGEYPDYSYTSKGQIGTFYQNPQNDVGCGCLLDHDRINKIESNTNIIKGEHQGIRQRINDLKVKINMIIQQTRDMRSENGALNMKTLELKKQYNNLIEAEAALRAENDDLMREKHELLLKKNELGFYIKEPHSHESIKEVSIPIDGKRRRPTNVSKTDKQFGGGYTSTTTHNPKSSFPGL